MTSSVNLINVIIPIAITILSYLLHKKIKTQTVMSLKETSSNILNFLIWNFVFISFGVALQLTVFTWVKSFIPWTIPTNPASIVASVFFIDFLYYIKHRYEHEWNFLWAQHNVHHSSEELNFSTALRLPWLGSYLSWFFFIPALLVGFSAIQVVISYRIILTYQFFVHTEFVQSLGPLEKILNTPSHHRAHHGKNPQYINKNYGGILIVWDKLFGTFCKEEEPVNYGLVQPILSRNPIIINFKPWLLLFKKCFSKKGLNFKILFQRPDQS